MSHILVTHALVVDLGISESACHLYSIRDDTFSVDRRRVARHIRRTRDVWRQSKSIPKALIESALIGLRRLERRL